VSLWERLKSWRGKKTPEPEERLLRPSEVARRLGVAKTTVYRWFQTGRLRGVRLKNGTVRIYESSAKAMLGE
jgi:excisionase family DNA binding protein